MRKCKETPLAFSGKTLYNRVKSNTGGHRMSLGSNLSDARKKKGLSQEAVAEKLGYFSAMASQARFRAFQTCARMSFSTKNASSSL